MKTLFPYLKTILSISAGLLLFLVWFIYFKTPFHSDQQWVSTLPTVNASLNLISLCFMIAGIVAIKNKHKARHKQHMLCAVCSSALFLIGYLLYHHFHGDTLYMGEGIMRLTYFFILISHIILTIVALPLILLTVTYGLLDKTDTHKKIARYTFPIWVYISVTGILIYLILHL